MDNKLRNVLGLLDTGKRVYQLKDGAVTQADFEYCSVITQVLWGELGLVPTLGPTWDMVHDPRFEKIERTFITSKPSYFGGDTRTGIQRQLADGTFDGGMAGIEQYAEILGEGRNLIDSLRSKAIIDAISELYPDLHLRINPRDIRNGLPLVAPYTPKIREQIIVAIAKADNSVDIDTLGDDNLAETAIQTVGTGIFEELGVLTPQQKVEVIEKANSYEIYKPHNFQYWPEAEIWRVLFADYTNYFTRKGEPNQVAKTLYALIKADLLGLVADYAEVANVQETVLLEDPAELYDPDVHGEEADRVSMEVENLERALTYRAELRVTAYKIIKELGIESQMVELTDIERDQLLQIIYTSDFLGDKAGTVSKIIGYLAGIRVFGKSLEEREFLQVTQATEKAQQHIASLKDGSIKPISRYTEESSTFEWSPEEAMIQRVLLNPIAGYTFSRLTAIEKRISLLSAAFIGTPDNPDRADVVKHWIEAAQDPSVTFMTTYNLTDADIASLQVIENLVKAQAILKPVFEDASFVWTDDVAADLLTKVEYLDPTPELQVTELPEGSDPGNQAPLTIN